MFLALAAQNNNFGVVPDEHASDKVLMESSAAHYKAIGKKLDGEGVPVFKTLEEPAGPGCEMVASRRCGAVIALFDEGRKAKK
ncbi:MAG: hypothetical protein IPK33_09970 [Gemmatimonadetes bacterium]|nr:hypothetical protein [Gemmatimonadota bacterium]